MSALQALRSFISPRLSAALDDILAQLDSSIRDCELEMERRQRNLLEGLIMSDQRSRAADVQQMLVRKEQLRRSCGLDQDHEEQQEVCLIKEEPEQVCAGSDGGPVLETEVYQFTFTQVKSEDEDKPELFQLHLSAASVEEDHSPPPGPSPGPKPTSGQGSEVGVADWRSTLDSETSSDSFNQCKSFGCSECGLVCASKAS